MVDCIFLGLHNCQGPGVQTRVEAVCSIMSQWLIAHSVGGQQLSQWVWELVLEDVHPPATLATSLKHLSLWTVASDVS